MKNLILILIFGTLLVSCDTASDGPKKAVVCSPVDYGNGVYYFPCMQEDFAISLSVFLADSSLIFKGMTGNGKGVYGEDLGYFVVVEKVKKVLTLNHSLSEETEKAKYHSPVKISIPKLQSARSKPIK